MPPKKAAKPKPSPKRKKAPAAPDLSKTAATLSRLRGNWPPLAADTRAAFRALATDEQRSKLGKQTRAEAVLGEGVRWAIQIDDQLRLHPDAIEHYKIPRFVYFLERLQALHERLTAERARRAQLSQKRDDALSERELAVRARRRLVRRLETFAGRRDAERAQIAAALGTSDTDENLIRSITALTSLASSFVARTDAISHILAKNAGLSPEWIEVAVESGKALGRVSADASLEGRASSKDSPLVNRDEGDVLLEMDEAMGLFADAAEENHTIRKLSPGPATRYVLGTRKPTPKGGNADSGGGNSPSTGGDSTAGGEESAESGED